MNERVNELAAMVPSAFIRSAVEDFQSILKNPMYRIDMDMWHAGADDPETDVCHVCLAGSVLAGIVNDPRKDAKPEQYPELTNFLHGLNSLRNGSLCNAAHRFGFEDPTPFEVLRNKMDLYMSLLLDERINDLSDFCLAFADICEAQGR